MAEANDIIGMVYQNLLDAGCDERTTEKCMVFVKNGEYQKLLPILSHFRAGLLENVHSGQKKIDCLDYLIYKINKNIF
jgi:hypothetical protein